ncbi:MAG: type II CAAX endopeptidase family protein [Actinomycetota bacterium]
MSDYLQDVEWSIPQVLYVFFGGLVGALITTTAVLFARGDDLDLMLLAASFAGQAGGNFAVMWLLSQRRGTRSLRRDFGLAINVGHWWGIPGGLFLQIAVVLVTAPLLRVFFPDGAPQQGVAEITEQVTTFADGLIIVLMVGIAAPVVEEMLFRGMLLSRLVRSMSPAWAVIVQALVFGGVHLLDPSAVAALPGLVIVGGVLGYAAIRTGSLSLPIMLHAGVNLTAVVLLIFGGSFTEWLDELAETGVTEALLSLIG